MNRILHYLFLGIVFQLCFSCKDGEYTNVHNSVNLLPDNHTEACHSHQGVLQCTEADFRQTDPSSVEVLRLTSLRNTSVLDLSLFTNLRKLEIRHTNITSITSLPQSPSLEEINISCNPNLTNINIVSNMSSLKILNLSYNNMKRIDTAFLVLNLTSVDLTGNNWTCTENYSRVLFLHRQGKLKNPLDLKCLSYKDDDDWNTYTFRIIHLQEAEEVIESQCKERTPKCSCKFLNRKAGDSRILYNISVSCSGRNLMELPDQLPDLTRELDISNNSITNLNKVGNYPDLLELNADNNNITSVKGLSGTNFVRNFTLLSLRSNPIPAEEIPLDDFKLDVTLARFVSLGNNSWGCSKYLATKVRTWLWSNRQMLERSMPLDIYCSDQDGTLVDVLFYFPDTRDETSGSVLTVHWLIAIEVSLILLVWAKLSFDAYDFKKNGRLPWLASKIF